MKIAIDNNKITSDITSLVNLTPSNNDIIYVSSLDEVYYFKSNISTGDYLPASGGGFWVKDTITYSSLWEIVSDNYDFNVNNKIEVNDIVLLDRYGEEKIGFKRTRDIIKVIVVTDTAMYTTWDSYQYQFLAAKWFAAPYALRLTVQGWSESQDEEAWDPLINKTKGMELESLSGRSLIVELMRRRASHELRKEELTKEDLDDFWLSTFDLFNEYIDTNGIHFIDWLTNKVGSNYENNGFEQKTYWSQQLEDDLVAIYNGEYIL